MSSAYLHNHFTAQKSIAFDMAITEGQFTDYWNMSFISSMKRRRKYESRNNVKKSEYLSDSFTN